MITDLPQFITRYWMVVIIIAFALLSAYTSSPLYGQSADPTPDINTVPRPEILPTATNTPFPTPTPEVIPDNSDEEPVIDANDDQTDIGSLDSGFEDSFVDEPVENTFGDSSSNPIGGGLPESNTGGISNSNSGGTFSGSGTSGGVSIDTATNADGTVDLEELPPIEAGSLDSTGITGGVNVVTLNVRRGPGVNTPILDTLFLNEVVELLARNSNDTWWYICCGTGSGNEGWVDAQYITLGLAQQEASTQLPVTVVTQNGTETTENEQNESDPALVLEMRPRPAFAWQGQRVQLQFVLRNLGDTSYTNVRLRNDLPPTLTYIDATAGQQVEVATMGDPDDGLIYTLNWPEITAGAELAATITLQIAADLPNGAFVDNLAVVDTAEGASALAGITFAMPPQGLPQFR